jgi:hypothetical protein
MKIKKVFENIQSHTWEDDFFNLYDSFLELEDNNIGRVDYQAGYSSFYNNQHIVGGMDCFMKNGEIMGNKDAIYHMIDKAKSLPILKAIIYPNFENENKSPFRYTHSASFFGENAKIFIKIIKLVDSASKKLYNYDFDVTTSNNGSVDVTFIQKIAY